MNKKSESKVAVTVAHGNDLLVFHSVEDYEKWRKKCKKEGLL